MDRRGVQWLAGLLLMTAVTAAAAQERVEVGVTFDVRALHFTSAFDDEGIQALKVATGAAIAEALGRHVRFLRFSASDTAAHRLEVVLARADGTDQAGVSEFGLHLRLQGGELGGSRQTYLVLRPIDRFFEPVGSVEGLTREIEQAINGSDHRALVADLLSEIPIADDARFMREEASWVIERDRLALCIGYNSRLRVLSQVPFGASGVRRDWFPAVVIDVIDPQNRIFAETADEAAKARLQGMDPARLKVERVAVADYFLCQMPIPASEVDFSDAGGTP